MDETRGYHCLGHSNWTICSLFSPICSGKFPPFALSYWEANSYYPRCRGPIIGKGNSANSRNGWDKGLSLPGAFELDHLQPIQPHLFCKISIFSTFLLGSQFLLPQRAHNGKREFSQLQKWMRQGVFIAWSIQTGQFASLFSPIWSRKFPPFPLS